MPDTAPFSREIEARVEAVAAGSDLSSVIAEADFTGALTAATFTPKANITGNSTESRTYTVVNKGQDGNGTTVMATLAMTTGVNATDFNEDAMTLSAVANARDVVDGDVIAFVSTHVGATGLADPGGLVKLTFGRGEDT